MEPDFPVDAVSPQPQGFDIADAMRRALAPYAGVLNRQAPTLPSMPGNPLVPEDAMRAAIARAMSPTPPPLTGDERSSIMGRMGAALMQPRQQGQSVAGNIGQATAGASQMADSIRAQNQKTAMAQTELGTATMNSETNRQIAQQNMAIMAAKFPVEFAEMQQRLRTAVLTGNAAEVQFIRAELMKQGGAERIAKSLNTEQAKADADVSNVQAQSRQHDAQSEYLLQQARVLIPAHAKAYEGLNKPDAFRVIDKDQGLVAVMTPSGGFETFKITPGITDPKLAYAQAQKELNEQAKQAHMAKGGWGWTAPSADQAAIQKRAMEIMQGKVESMGVMGGQRTNTQGAPQQPSPMPGAASPQSQATPQKYQKAMANTQYDQLFNQYDTMYKFPPGTLKRLAATESGMNPNASNTADPGGGSFGLMQVQKQHFGSNDNPNDPATNIGRAAALLAQYRDASGGDLNVALQKYKGASSDTGKAKVGGDISFIAGGGGTPAAAPAQVAQAGQPGSSAANPIKLGGTGGNVAMPKGNSEIVATPSQEGAPTTQKQAEGQNYQQKVLALGEQFEAQYPKLKAFRVLMMSKNPNIATHGYQQYHSLLESIVGKISL